jgi:hypothetical protein
MLALTVRHRAARQRTTLLEDCQARKSGDRLKDFGRVADKVGRSADVMHQPADKTPLTGSLRADHPLRSDPGSYGWVL